MNSMKRQDCVPKMSFKHCRCDPADRHVFSEKSLALGKRRKLHAALCNKTMPQRWFGLEYACQLLEEKTRFSASGQRTQPNSLRRLEVWLQDLLELRPSRRPLASSVELCENVIRRRKITEPLQLSGDRVLRQKSPILGHFGTNFFFITTSSKWSPKNRRNFNFRQLVLGCIKTKFSNWTSYWGLILQHFSGT